MGLVVAIRPNAPISNIRYLAPFNFLVIYRVILTLVSYVMQFYVLYCFLYIMFAN